MPIIIRMPFRASGKHSVMVDKLGVTSGAGQESLERGTFKLNLLSLDSLVAKEAQSFVLVCQDVLN
jgi:hypothetical protein